MYSSFFVFFCALRLHCLEISLVLIALGWASRWMDKGIVASVPNFQLRLLCVFARVLTLLSNQFGTGM